MTGKPSALEVDFAHELAAQDAGLVLVARIGIEAMLRREILVVPGLVDALSAFLARLLPPRHQESAADLMLAVR